ncbi:MAG: hypothetical protein QXP20_06080, partial [Candidatus Bathyarchaeia archaeon]
SSTNSGIVVDHGDVEGLRQAVLSLKNNKENAKMMGRNARELAASMFSSEIFRGKITRIFREMLHQNGNSFITRKITVK